MMVTGWILTKVDNTEDGPRPLIASLSASWRAGALPLTEGGWMLCHVKTHPEVVAFMKQDEDFIWIGNDWSKVPQEVLDTYAEKLNPEEQYLFIGQVVDKLSEWEPRFNMRAD